MYGEFLFNSFHLGFAVGIAPIVGFQYGAQNKAQLKRIYKTTFIFVVVSSVVITVVAALLAKPIVSIFTKDPGTWELASVGFQIFAINFLFSGVNIASSGFFTVQRKSICTDFFLQNIAFYRYIFTRVAANMGTERSVGCDSFLRTVYLGAVSLYTREIFYKKE